MIHEIQAKTLLAHVKQPDDWFGLRYNMNLYRGCQHRCIYCDSRSECYQIENFDRDVLVKVNAIDLLRRELARKRVRGTIGTGSMNDPYMPVEKHFNLTGRALEVIAQFRFPVHVITKSNLVLKDLDTLRTIQADTLAMVSFTITTADDALARKLEPGAPPPSARYRALQTLSEQGIHTGVTLMPVLPFVEDNVENIRTVVEQAHAHGARYILPAFGMTLRNRQRAYYYEQLDVHFPGVKERYQRKFGGSYSAAANQLPELEAVFYELCECYGIANAVPQYRPEPQAEQLTLF